MLLSCCIGCGSGTEPYPSYDLYTRRLTRLDLDTNQNGRVDQRTYLNGNVPLRSELDLDDDGRVDRWEYVDAQGTLVTVGASSRNDGVEDRWTTVAESNGERRLTISTGRTRQIDRWEFFRGDQLVRVEEDSNEDGRPDKWETFEAGRLRLLAFDTTRVTGRPDTRLVYDAAGKVERAERDPDGDGRFAVVSRDQIPAGAIR